MNFNDIKKIDNNFYYYKVNNFATIRLRYYFRVRITKKNNLIHNILTDYIDNSNLIYKTKKDMRYKEKDLYNLSIIFDNKIVGNIAYLFLNINIIDQKMIGENYFDDVKKYINDYIFKVDFNNKLELENIKNRIINNYYNKNYNLKADSKYFKNILKDDTLGKITFDNIDELKDLLRKVHLSDLEKEYHKILNSYVFGYVFGNTTDEEIKMLNISNRFNKALKMNTNYDKNIHIDFKDMECTDDQTSQSILYVTYEVKNYNKKKTAIYETIYNLLSSSLTSLLMTTLRTKYGLVYSAGSFHISHRNLFCIVANIDEKNKDKTLEAIDEVFNLMYDKDLVTKKINDHIELIKQNDFLMPERINAMNNELVLYLLKNDITYDEFYNDTINMTYDKVINEVKNMTKKDIFFYRGTKK